MNNDSSSTSAASRIEDLIQAMPPGSRLPSYRELQQRYRLSPATVQRMLADLSRRGLLVTRPGSGTYTAQRRPPASAADVSWQTLALGSRRGLNADLERLVDPGAPDALPLTSVDDGGADRRD
jgi:DNA-binding GntR family transcriptional regulator